MKITIYSAFSKEQKHLRKRYKNINKDIIKLINELQENPLLGTDLGNGIRKIRMKISDPQIRNYAPNMIQKRK